MKIMHLILSRGFAGSERTAAQLCNVQSETHDVTLVIRRNHTKKGVSITQYISPRVRIVLVNNWFQRAAIARAIKQFQPDVIHGHLRRSTKMLAKIRQPAATIVTLHLTVNGPHFADMDGIICIAKWQLKDLPPNYKGKAFWINPGYIPHRRLSPEEIQALRSELGVKPHEFMIGAVGRLAKSKGFDILIEAFKRANLKDAKLVIIGEGRERKRLQRLCNQNITLGGFRKNIKDYYQAFDLFVCPSRREPFGYVLLEALDAGVPPLAAAALGPYEILEAYPGEIFQIGNVAQLSHLLRKYDRVRLPKMAQDMTPYRLETIAEQTEAAYREIIAAKRMWQWRKSYD